MSRTFLTKLAVLTAFGILGTAANSQAGLVASFIAAGQDNYSYDGTGATTTLSTTSAAGVSGVVLFGPEFTAANSDLSGAILATLNFSVESDANAISAAGVGTQNGFNGSYTITANVAGAYGAAGTTLLSLDINNESGVISSVLGTNVLSFSAADTLATATNVTAPGGVPTSIFVLGVATEDLPDLEDVNLELVSIRDANGNATTTDVSGGRFVSTTLDTPIFFGSNGSSTTSNVVIPEPGTLAMAAIGLPLLGIGYLRHRRRKAG